MMSFTEKLLETICIAVNGKPEREIDGNIVSFKAPYRRCYYMKNKQLLL